VFSQFKGLTFENSYCFKLDSSFQEISADLSFECKAVGPWLLNYKPWLEQMMDTRELNREMYFSRFPPSINSLTRYLVKGPIENPNQILFLIFDQLGILHGHVGLKLDLAGNFNFDNILRIDRSSPGVMKMALQALLTWGNKILGISEYSLQVISTNKRAIAIYNELGFSLQKRMNLRTENFSEGITNLVPATKEDSNTTEEMFIMRIKL
jgi:hypothetical protein